MGVFKKNKEMQTKLETDLEGLKSKWELELRNVKEKDSTMMREKQEKWETEYKNAFKQLSTVNTKVAKITTANKELKSQNNSLVKELKDLRATLTALDQEHATEMNELSSRFNETCDRNAKLESRVAQLSNATSKLAQDVGSLHDSVIQFDALLANASVHTLQAMCPDLSVAERCKKSDDLLRQILPGLKEGVLRSEKDTSKQVAHLSAAILSLLQGKAKLGQQVNRLYTRFLASEDD